MTRLWTIVERIGEFCNLAAFAVAQSIPKLPGARDLQLERISVPQGNGFGTDGEIVFWSKFVPLV